MDARRFKGAKTVTITKNEILTGLNKPDEFILAIVIIIFGANRLPEIGRGIGSAIKNFKSATKDHPDTPKT